MSKRPAIAIGDRIRYRRPWEDQASTGRVYRIPRYNVAYAVEPDGGKPKATIVWWDQVLGREEEQTKGER